MSSDMIEVPPRWKIIWPDQPLPEEGTPIVIQPGEGFGDGSHSTTYLCLQALATYAPRDGQAWRTLDFGSGSGVLAIGAARLGATVDGVEIDGPSIVEAEENARLNGVGGQLSFSTSLDDVSGPYDMILANILREVLMKNAEALIDRLAPAGTLVLSGLVATDVPALSARYGELLDGQRPQIFDRDPWRALVWRRG